MLSHELPPRRSRQNPWRGGATAAPAGMVAVTLRESVGGCRHHEPLRVELHVAARRQGTGFDSGSIPAGAGARRLRRPLRLSDAGPASDRRRGECAAQRDRAAGREFSTGFGGARESVGGALWDERNAECRWRRPRDPERATEEPRGNRGRGHVRRSWPQVSDLGTRALPYAARGGHRDGAHAEAAAGIPEGRARGAGSTGMTMGRDTDNGVAGGLARHIPVLGHPAVEFLNVRDSRTYIDGTFGAGGHSRMILAAADCRVIALDRDQSAIAGGAGLVAEANGRLTLVEDRFSELDRVAREFGVDAVDGVLLDVGVSSMQLDEAARGFSFRQDGPLDMRMGREGVSAAEVIAHASERDLAAIIHTLGEERHARAVARAIAAARREAPITSTRSLADIVARVVRAKPGDIHPATRTFQGLRIFVNEELAELAQALAAAERILKPGGRLVVISFHSLEDRIVKSFLAARGQVRHASRHLPQADEPELSFRLLTRRPVTPDAAETAANPRARSAKLRAAERAAAPARVTDIADLLPRLPALADTARIR